MLPTPASAHSTPQASSSGKSDISITDFTIRISDSSARRREQSAGTELDTPGQKGRSGSARQPEREEAARWNSFEFKVYYVIFALVVPVMVYWPMRLSSESHPNYWFYAHRLSPGWLFGRQVDNSDAQYSSFRSNIPGLLSLALAYLLLSSLRSRISLSPSSSPTSTRPLFLCITSIVILVILHGASACKILAILYANYRVCVLVSGQGGPAAAMGAREGSGGRIWQVVQRIWPGVLIAGNMGVLFICERYRGLPLGGLHESLSWLDAYSGLLAGWQHHFKITMLRIVSFGLDYHWRLSGSAATSPATSVSTASEIQTPTDHRSRVSRPVAEGEYNLVNFVAYAVYAPLYIAGPIMTFNDFTWQMKHPVAIPWREKLSYGLRFVFCFLTMESVLHTMYVVAIKDTHAWEGDSPADLSMIGFWNLVVVWLKLLIPWRFFRFWALLDGVEAPENMIRCVANNYSTLGFWRSWHRSYNLWVVRYIYIPVGGGRNAALSTLLVFTFVALWHDLSFKLLAWGWLVSLFILPELAARKLLPFAKHGYEPWYRHVAAAGGVGNILLMMSANLVGFVLGIEGMKHLVMQLSTTIEGWLFTAFSCACLFVAVQVMFEYRAEEGRRGIDRRC